MNLNKTPSGIHPIGYDRPLFKEDIYPYKNKSKLSEPTLCEQCGAVYHEGRWQWIKAPENAHKETCSACHRINDNYPAGFVTLEGAFFEAHREEIKRLIQNHAEHERAEHPYKRIMNIENQDAAMLITTTDTHLAHGIGEAIHHAYQGELKVDRAPGENLVRVRWSR